MRALFAPSSAQRERLWRHCGAHAHTILPWLGGRLHPPRMPAGTPWSMLLADEEVRLTGVLHHPDEAKHLVILVHGLGGCAESAYVKQAAAQAYGLQLATLRINQRGADCRGDDIYHAGLFRDLFAVLASSTAESYRQVSIFGFSLGGHTALGAAAQGHPRLHAVVALCPPLVLEQAALALDRPSMWIYRTYILRSLKAIYRAVHRRHQKAREQIAAAPLRQNAPRNWPPWEEVRRVHTMAAWDGLVVAPRFGYPSAEAYWRAESVAPKLAWVQCPTLLVRSRHDPLVQDGWSSPAELGPRLKLEELEKSGHLGFCRSEGDWTERALHWLAG